MIDVETTILGASLFGALLFFAAGWLVARAARPSPAVRSASKRPATTTRPTPAVLASRAQAIAAEVSAARALDDERRRRLEAEAARDALLGEQAGRDVELTNLRARAAELQHALQDALELHAHTQTTMEVTLDARDRALAAAREAHEQAERQAAELREQKAQLLAALDTASTRVVELQEIERADARLAELRLALELAEGRLAETDALREENVQLRAAAYELEDARLELARVERHNGELRARLFVEETVHAASLRPTGPRTTLDRTMNALASSAGVRAAVLADDLGFPVAGSGTEMDALAAFTGFLMDVGAKARAMLPLGEVQCVSVVAEHGVTVSVCPVQRGDLGLALATLAIGPGPNLETLTRAAKQAVDVVGLRETEEVSP